MIVCLEEATGKVLWQATHDKLPTGRVNDWPEQGICSSPFVDGNRIYYVSNRAELVCADVEGFLDGENDGPFQDEKYREKEDADIVWVYDMIEELGVFPHNLATSSPVGAGDLIFLLTSNGVDEGHLDLPMPDAPAFIAVDKNTGELVMGAERPGREHPARAVVLTHLRAGQGPAPGHFCRGGRLGLRLRAPGWRVDLEVRPQSQGLRVEAGRTRHPQQHHLHAGPIRGQGAAQCGAGPGAWRGSRSPLFHQRDPDRRHHREGDGSGTWAGRTFAAACPPSPSGTACCMQRI